MNDSVTSGVLDVINLFQWAPLIISVATGVCVGLIFSVGLWHTVRSLQGRDRPLSLFVASMLLRIGLAVTAFVWLMQFAGWVYLIVALFVFVITRDACIRFKLAERQMPRNPTGM